MTGNLNIKLYNTIRRELNLSEEKSQTITQAIEEAIYADNDSQNKELATKDFVKKEIAEARKEIAEKISESKTDTIKWLFGLFFANALMVIGLYLKK
jgi:hypothetical protein